MPGVPRVPNMKLPLVGDPLRRIHVARDLAPITTDRRGGRPRVGRARPHDRRADLGAARRLYRSGVHPALTLCVRRHGEVVLDRASVTAWATGPTTTARRRRMLATPETPFCVYSTSKAITAMVVHVLHERGALDIGDRVADYIPEYDRHGKSHTTIAHVLAHRAGVPTLPREVLDLENIDDSELIIDAIAGPSRSSSPARCSPTTRSPAASSSARSSSGSPARRSARCSPSRSSIRSASAGPTTASPRRTSTRSASTTRPARGCCRRCRAWPRACSSRPVDDVIELSNDPRFLTA